MSIDKLVFDTSGNSHALSAYGFLTANGGPILNGQDRISYTFDGNTYIKVPSSVFELGDSNEDFTIEMWIRPIPYPGSSPQTVVGTMDIISSNFAGASSSSWGTYWYLNIETTGKVHFGSRGTNSAVNPSLGFDIVSEKSIFHPTYASNPTKWSHIALVRYNGVMTMFIDGTHQGSTDVPYDFSEASLQNMPKNIGRSRFDAMNSSSNYYHGLMQNFRVIKGVAKYRGPTLLEDLQLEFTDVVSEPVAAHETVREPACSDVMLLVQSDTVDPEGGIVDTSSNQHLVTVSGSVYHDANVSNYGSSSLHFDGSYDYLDFPNIGTLDGDLTMEAWVNFNDLSQYQVIITPSTDTSPNFLRLTWHYVGGGSWHVYGGVASTDWYFRDLTMTANEWHHVALVRRDGRFKLYRDGKQRDIEKDWDYVYSYPTGIRVGKNWGPYYDEFAGYLDDIRISKHAVYLRDFIPPTQSHDSCVAALVDPIEPACNDISLLIQSDTSDETDDIIDTSGNNCAVVTGGAPNHMTQANFNWHEADDIEVGSSAIHFNGTSDYLAIGDTSTFNFLHDGSTDYTIEFWMYLNGTPSTGSVPVLSNHAGSSSGTAIDCFIKPTRAIHFNIHRGVTSTVYHSFQTFPGAVDVNKWHHIAVVFQNGLQIYIDGIQQASGGNSYSVVNSPSMSNAMNPLFLGTSHGYSPARMNAYIQDFRISKAVVYTGNFAPPTQLHSPCITLPSEPDCSLDEVSLLLKSSAEGIWDGSWRSEFLMDNGWIDHATIGNAVFPTGGADLTASGEYLGVPSSSDFLFTGDHTIESWIWWDGTAPDDGWSMIYSTGGAGDADQFAIAIDPTGTFGYSHEGIMWCYSDITWTDPNGRNIPPANEWVHVAATRSGQDIMCFVNGVLTATGTRAGNIGSSTTDVSIGMRGVDNRHEFGGYIQDLRISKHAVYTNNFIPPTEAHPTC